jgi:hypothetical protein
MKLHFRLLLAGVFLISMALIIASCSAKPTVAPEPTQTLTVEPAPVLEITGKNGSINLTFDELKALPVTEGYAGIKSSTGKITPPTLFKGVSLKDLAEAYGDMTDSDGLNVVASDGYGITFSYNQTKNGTFIAYDPATGVELKSAVALTAILAYEQDGQPLNPNEDGVLRIAIVSSEPNQVIDGHWAVKWVNKLEFKNLGQEWTLTVNGPYPATIDRASFQSCSAPQCHGVTWKDEKAQEWVGVPVWLLAGYVDDEIIHEGPAYNDALADSGYPVDLVASDGYKVTLDSLRIKRNANILVAYTVNGNPLPDDYFPLRLVGKDLLKNEMVGMINSISIGLTPIEEEINTVVPGSLIFNGLVDKEMTWSEADLRSMKVVTISAEHPKNGIGQYEGIRLNSLLDLAGVQTGATNLVIMANDGYSTEISLTDIRACTDCLVGFDTSGILIMVMPGFPSNTWIKDVVRLGIK